MLHFMRPFAPFYSYLNKIWIGVIFEKFVFPSINISQNLIYISLSQSFKVKGRMETCLQGSDKPQSIHDHCSAVQISKRQQSSENVGLFLVYMKKGKT